MAKNRTVLVTGASSGIGRAVALEFARRGASVAVLARTQDRLEEVVSCIGALGCDWKILVADVADRAKVEAAVREVAEFWGRLDILVNNAGYLTYGAVEDCTIEDFEGQIAVNYLGAVYATKAALPIMRQQGTGAIINVSSISGRIFVPNNAAYQASKAALRAFALTLRAELLGSGISVSLITPGRTRTGIAHEAVQRTPAHGQPLLGEMPVERVARIVVDCADRPRREVVEPRTLRLLLGIYAVSPWTMERLLPKAQAVWASLHRSRQ